MSKKGIDHALEAIRGLDPDHQKRLLENVARLDAKTAANLREGLFTFEDLHLINPKGVTVLMSAVEDRLWSLALRKVSQDVAKHIFSHISGRRADQLKEVIRNDGPKPMSKVIEAQKEIVAIALKLEKDGKIVINRTASEDPLV